jgi:hypothetical protein
MNNLSISDYRRCETEAESVLANRVIEAFHAAHFEKVGYPIRVPNEAAIFKYVDAMHERRHDAFVQNLFGGALTDEEFAFLDRFLGFYWERASSAMGRILPIDCLLNSLHAAMPIRRMLSRLGGTGRVFEIGPGSGYLTGMLAMEGIPVVATDVCEGFYLFQNRLFNLLAPDNACELAADALLPTPNHPGIQHLPWWKYVQPAALRDLRFDVIAACHCVTEMHPWAFRYFLKNAATMLADSQLGFLVIDGWGSDVPRKPSEILREVHAYGWKVVFSDGTFTILQHDPAGRITDCQTLPWSSHQTYDVAAAEQHVVTSWRPRRFSGNAGVAALFDRKTETDPRRWTASALRDHYAKRFPDYARCADVAFFESIDFFI